MPDQPKPQQPAIKPTAPGQAAPPAPAPAIQPAVQQPAQKPSEIVVTEQLLADHNKLRVLIGEFRAFLNQFMLTGLRRTAREILDLVREHHLKEETALFLIGMKELRADNEKIPELIREHHEGEGKLFLLLRLLYAPSLQNNEDQIRNLVVTICDSLEDHMNDEDKTVFPAFEKLLSDDLKTLILERFRSSSPDPEDELLNRTPLISLGEMPSEPDEMGNEIAGLPGN